MDWVLVKTFLLLYSGDEIYIWSVTYFNSSDLECDDGNLGIRCWLYFWCLEVVCIRHRYNFVCVDGVDNVRKACQILKWLKTQWFLQNHPIILGQWFTFLSWPAVSPRLSWEAMRASWSNHWQSRKARETFWTPQSMTRWTYISLQTLLSREAYATFYNSKRECVNGWLDGGFTTSHSWM